MKFYDMNNKNSYVIFFLFFIAGWLISSPLCGQQTFPIKKKEVLKIPLTSRKGFIQCYWDNNNIISFSKEGTDATIFFEEKELAPSSANSPLREEVTQKKWVYIFKIKKVKKEIENSTKKIEGLKKEITNADKEITKAEEEIRNSKTPKAKKAAEARKAAAKKIKEEKNKAAKTESYDFIYELIGLEFMDFVEGEGTKIGTVSTKNRQLVDNSRSQKDKIYEDFIINGRIIKKIEPNDQEVSDEEEIPEIRPTWNQPKDESSVENIRKKINSYRFEESVKWFKEETDSCINHIEDLSDKVAKVIDKGNILSADIESCLQLIRQVKDLQENEKNELQIEFLTLTAYKNEINQCLIKLASAKIDDVGQEDSIKADFQRRFASQIDTAKYDKLIAEANMVLNKKELLHWLYLQKGRLPHKVRDAYEEISKQYATFDIEYKDIILKISKDHNVTQNICAALLSEEKDILSEALYKRLQALDDLCRQIDAVKIPYVSLILIAITAFILLFGIYFYIKAYKNRKKNKDKQTGKEKMGEKGSTDQNETAVRIIRPETNKAKVGIDLNEEKKEYTDIYISEIFPDSQVQKIYFKKDCLSELYRFFSNTLKDTEKTKEAGCYLLGCWEEINIHGSGKAYNITYEVIVTPGDDAIYGEYELNFGAKIGMKMSKRISELREKTGKQYVLTAWVHSHPGLGIFLSNHDLIVQNQLEDREHPGRLTAMVIDVLTPEMKFVIFTARKSGEMNGHDDVKVELSLEDIYRQSKNPGTNENRININLSDYRDILSPNLVNESMVSRILLNSRSIIEIEEKANIQKNGIAGYFVGNTAIINGEKTKSIVVNSLISPDELNNYKSTDIKGVLIACERFYTGILYKMKDEKMKPEFTVVFEQATENVACIPLITPETYSAKFFTEPYFELLKWTRRKQ